MSVADDVKRFEQLYRASPDPWDYRTSRYEHEKYQHTLAALPPTAIKRCLEVGCSIGVMTELLATRCEQVLAIDFSPSAVELAHENLAGTDNVEVRQARFPEAVPDGTWDLVTCSEVLYYLQEASLQEAIDWLRTQLVTGASIVVVSWRGAGRDEPYLGDQVHDLLRHELADWHALDARQTAYRIDRFDGR